MTALYHNLHILLPSPTLPKTVGAMLNSPMTSRSTAQIYVPSYHIHNVQLLATQIPNYRLQCASIPHFPTHLQAKAGISRWLLGRASQTCTTILATTPNLITIPEAMDLGSPPTVAQSQQDQQQLHQQQQQLQQHQQQQQLQQKQPPATCSSSRSTSKKKKKEAVDTSSSSSPPMHTPAEGGTPTSYTSNLAAPDGPCHSPHFTSSTSCRRR